MNNKLKKLIVIFLIFLITIFLLNIFINRIERNKSDITNMNILHYIPNNYEMTILSNTTNNYIKKYINANISERNQEQLNIIQDSIISYLGFDLKEKFEDIYDNEFALTLFKNKLNKNDILLIFKLKKNKNINNIINSGEDLNNSDHIFELKRQGKINYISHILQTKDNYVIASSDKNLVNASLQLKNNNNTQILSRNLIPDDIDLKKIKLLSISRYINIKNNSNSGIDKINKLITIINSEDNKIKVRSFSPNINKVNARNNNIEIDNIKGIIFSNKYSLYKEKINFLHNNVNQKELIDEISQEVNDKLLLITNNNNWIMCFKSKVPDEIPIDQFNFLKKYKKEELNINNINYAIYTNDRLELKDKNITYKKENPIFSLKDDQNTYISNDFDALLNINEKTNLSDQYLNNYSDIQANKFILNDIIYIKSINNKQLVEYYKSLKYLQYFINTELFSLEDIKINISQTIPEQNEKIYLESNLKIL